MSEPMILVKKADGSTVRLPLSEVKKLSAQNPAPAKQPEPVDKIEDQPQAVLPKPTFKIPVPEDHLADLGNPIENVKKLLSVQELPAAPVEPLLAENWATVPTETHLLHEEIEPHEIKHPDLVAKVSYEDSALAAAKAAKINLKPELQERFHSLATSLYKGVRTLDQVLAYVTLSADQGGLGLTMTEAERLKTALESLPGTPQMMTKPKALTEVLTPSKPIMPVKPTQTLGQRLPMRDVEPPAPTRATFEVMGPVEEMKKFDLTDWRRLSATPAKAKDMMIAKFNNLRTESYFLYQDARLAWYASPLLSMYQKVLVENLNADERLSERATKHVLSQASELTTADITAIVEINQSLTV